LTQGAGHGSPEPDDNPKERRVTRLDRYIFLRLLGVFGFFALVLVSVYWVNRAVRLFDRLISDGQPMSVFMELTLLSLPMVIRIVLPIASFVAAAYVTAQMMRESEIAAIHAAGISPLRLARPFALFGLVAMLAQVLLMNILIPRASAQLSLRNQEIAANVTSRLLTEGRFQHPSDHITVYVGRISPEGSLHGLYLSDGTTAGRRVDYTAATALIVPGPTGPQLVMIDGMAQVHETDTGRMSVTRFGDFTYDLAALMGTAGRGRSVHELPTSLLLFPAESLLAETRATLAQFRYEFAIRFAEGIGALATTLIAFGALLAGGFSRLARWQPILWSVALLGILQALINAVAGVTLQDARLAVLAFAPVGLGVATGLALILFAGRRYRSVPPGGETA
jgi:lipopolysaccharide export system permease protein